MKIGFLIIVFVVIVFVRHHQRQTTTRLFEIRNPKEFHGVLENTQWSTHKQAAKRTCSHSTIIQYLATRKETQSAVKEL
jgi:hypothetical protein